VRICGIGHETVVRDARTLRPISRLPTYGLTSGSTVSPDGRLAALAQQDGSLRLVNLRSGSSRTPSARHDAPVQSAAFSADGTTLVTGGDDARLIVWNVPAARPRAIFKGHAGRINGVALSPDGSTAFSASLDGTVIVWDLAGSRRLGRPFTAAPTAPHDEVNTVSETGSTAPTPASYNISASPDGETLTVAQGDGHVNLIDSRTLRLLARIKTTPGQPADSAAFTSDGRTMAIADWAGKLGFWDARTHAPLGARLKLSKAFLWPPRFSADGRWLAVTGIDAIVRLLDARRRTVVKQIHLDQLPRDMALRPDGKVLVVPATWGPGQGYVDILAVPSLKRIKRLPLRYGNWSRFSRDG
jgi:WD40 repeat protein